MIVRKKGHPVSLRVEEETIATDMPIVADVAMKAFGVNGHIYASRSAVAAMPGFRDSGRIYYTKAEREAKPQAVLDVKETDYLIAPIPKSVKPKVVAKRSHRSPFKRVDMSTVVVERK